MAKKEEKGKEQIKKKMELESKKLRLQLARMTAKAKKGQKMFNPWERDSDEWMHLSFIPDNDSKGDVEIYVKKCFKYNADDKEVYRCDHCPCWIHHRCLPAAVLAIAEVEGKDLADIDVDCDYCCY